MAQRNRVKINTSPVAQHYADEKIIEISSPNGGGLIAFRLTDDGELIIEPYRLDDTVKVNTGEAPQPATAAATADAPADPDPERGRLQVRVSRDDDFDWSMSDWDADLAEQTRGQLERGEMEVYVTDLYRLHCGARDCPHHELLGSLSGSVTPGSWEGTYTVPEVLAGIETDDHEHLTEIVRDMLPADYQEKEQS